MSMPTSEWGDIPSSSELFGNEFFGDELMEMYANGGGDDDDNDHVISSLLGESSPSPTGHSAVVNHDHAVKLEDHIDSEAAPAASQAEDDASRHPGLLIAMNAAAMDNDLGTLGSASEFAPVPVVSVSSLPSYPNTASSHAAIATSVGAPPQMMNTQATTAHAAPAPAAVTAALMTNKRPVAMPNSVPVQSPASKKRKGVTATAPAVPSAPPKAKYAATGGVGLPPGVRNHAPAPLMNAAPGMTLSSMGMQSRPAPAPATNAVITPKTGGGIAHQIVSRPSVVPSAVVSSARIMAPASSLTAAAKASGMIPKPAMGNNAPKAAPVCESKRAVTEADFKDVAHAAVTSLIQNASNNHTAPKPIVPPVPKINPKTGLLDKIDTSTAHVNALTSQNWVNACNPVPAPVDSSGSACDKAARNARRATLSQEERAKQNRDRNREHARNTRLRKKAYVEELKRTLTEIVAQRDAADLEKRHSAQREREQREVRFRVMEEFLKLRGRNELNAARWVAILEDGFSFTLPKTNYRQMVDNDKSQSQVSAPTSSSDLEQVLRGASAVMEDSQYLSSFLQSTAGGASPQHQVQLVYRCDRKRFFMDGNITFMDFAASTVGAVNKGAEGEMVFKGSMRASFSPASNKLISVDVTFDTGAITLQLERLGVSVPADAANAAAAAAAAAAHEADALLDSLQMPQMFADKKNATGAVSVSSDDGERSSDGSSGLHA